MDTMHFAGAVMAAGLFIYLLIALLCPERFS